ncbi:hypothetical protein V6N13_088525 [Hibiscus sabdariffa]
MEDWKDIPDIAPTEEQEDVGAGTPTQGDEDVVDDGLQQDHPYDATREVYGYGRQISQEGILLQLEEPESSNDPKQFDSPNDPTHLQQQEYMGDGG